MKFTQSSGQSGPGPDDCFTGTVFIDGIRNPDDQSAVPHVVVQHVRDAQR